MRVFVRYELDVSQPINLRRLSPVMKIYAGAVTKFHESKMYQTQQHKRQEAAHAEQVKKDELLKDYLLALMYRELTENKTLGQKDLLCSEIVISIHSEYRSSLQRVLKSSDFVLYNVTEVEENSDVRKAFKDMPVLLRVSKKSV